MKVFHILILLCTALLSSGCIDEIIDEHSRNKLVIWGDPPPDGRVGEPYTFRLGARVENTPFDDSYDFSFEFTDGRLPPGTEFMNIEEDKIDYAEVSGIPTEAGAYSFAVVVRSKKLKYEKEREEEDEKEDLFSLTNTEDMDEGLYTIYILE